MTFVTIVQHKSFDSSAIRYLSDVEIEGLINFLTELPNAGKEPKGHQ